jgi:hypothetical protein
MFQTRRRTIASWLIILTSAGLSIYWWQAAVSPMTPERYARLCGDASECYPEIGFALGSAAMGLVAVAVIFRLGLAGLRRRKVYQ